MKFCSLYSGSSGNCLFVSSGKTKFLIDAGLPGKTIENGLKKIEIDPNDIDGIFVTHEHIDHSKGVGVLSRRYDIPIYANKPTWDAMIKFIGNIKEHNIKMLDKEYLTIGDMDIIRYEIPHDAASPNGYAFCYKGKKICIATDLGYFSESVKKNVYDADVLLLESNHDVEMLKFGPYPYSLKCRILSNVGHLSNEACGQAIAQIAGNKNMQVILGHLSKTNNFPDLAYQTVINVLKDNRIRLNKDITVTMANRDMPSNYIEI